MAYISVIAGFYLLIQGADWLVKGSTSLAKRIGVSEMAIGLTVVAFGTSLPELVVNVIGSVSGNSGIVLGNIVGSNIANVFLILGAAAIVHPLIIKQQTVWREIPMSFLAAVVAVVMVGDEFISGHSFSLIDRGDGIILLCFFSIFLAYVISLSKTAESPLLESEQTVFSTSKTVWTIVAGLAGLVLGGKLVVTAAIALAQSWGISETVIGLTIVALGTSLPELVTSLVAAYRKSLDLAVGNVIGSNIFNVFFILGISALIRPIPVGSVTVIDEFMLMGTGLLLFAAIFVGKKYRLGKWEGAALIAIYCAYITSLFL
jgi:cation:H+ antiporter